MKLLDFSVLLEQLNLKILHLESKYGKMLYTAALQENYQYISVSISAMLHIMISF